MKLPSYIPQLIEQIAQSEQIIQSMSASVTWPQSLSASSQATGGEILDMWALQMSLLRSNNSLPKSTLSDTIGNMVSENDDKSLNFQMRCFNRVERFQKIYLINVTSENQAITFTTEGLQAVDQSDRHLKGLSPSCQYQTKEIGTKQYFFIQLDLVGEPWITPDLIYLLREWAEFFSKPGKQNCACVFSNTEEGQSLALALSLYINLEKWQKGTELSSSLSFNERLMQVFTEYYHHSKLSEDVKKTALKTVKLMHAVTLLEHLQANLVGLLHEDNRSFLHDEDLYEINITLPPQWQELKNLLQQTEKGFQQWNNQTQCQSLFDLLGKLQETQKLLQTYHNKVCPDQAFKSPVLTYTILALHNLLHMLYQQNVLPNFCIAATREKRERAKSHSTSSHLLLSRSKSPDNSSAQTPSSDYVSFSTLRSAVS